MLLLSFPFLANIFFYKHLTVTASFSAFTAFDAIGPITASGFNRTGSIFAYAVSYDWSKGHSGMTPGHPNKVMLYACKDDDVKKKKR